MWPHVHLRFTVPGLRWRPVNESIDTPDIARAASQPPVAASPATCGSTAPTPRPHTVAIIPARGGSKGIPLKNLQKISGVTLVGRAVDAARGSRLIDQVIVSTDHDQIADEALAHGASVVRRPADISSDTASSESALLYTLDRLRPQHEGDPAITVFIQCTSPFINPDDIDQAIGRVLADEADCVFSATEDHSFLWTLKPAQTPAHAQTPPTAIPVGHEASFRPRRQDRKKHFNETGAFYVMRTTGLREHGHRFFGRIAIQEVPPEDAREIDTLADLTALRIAAQTRTPASALDVDAIVTDFDGVHTDDSAFVDESGREHVRVHRGDGLGIAAARAAGLPFLILSKERNPVVGARAEKLRVEVMQGVDDKAAALRTWMADRNLNPARVAYIGNDVNDLPAFNQVGWPIAVADAHPSVLTAARLKLKNRGGHGAVRELCDLAVGQPAPIAVQPEAPPAVTSAALPEAPPEPRLHSVAG